MASATFTALPPQTNLKAAPGASADEALLLRKLQHMRDEAEEAKKAWLVRYDGTSDEDDLKLYRGEVVAKDAWFGCNFVQAMISRQVAQLTDNRPIMRVEHRKVGLRAMARALEKAVQATWVESDVQRQLFKLCQNAAVRRSAGTYVGYDEDLDETYVELLTIDQVLFDPAVTEAGMLQDAEYIHIKRIVPLSRLQKRFPVRGGLVKADVKLSPGPGKSKRLVDSPVTEILKFGASPRTVDAVPRAEVWESFIRDRQRDAGGTDLFPTYRRVLWTRDLILKDHENVFWDGQHPVDWFDWAVDPQHAWGHSEPWLLRKLQLSFNELYNGLIENQILSNFISVVGDHDALTPDQWKELQRIRGSLVLRKTATNKQLQVVPPVAFGADKIQIARQIFTYAQLLTGVTDVTLGETPGSLQSGVAIEGLQEGANLMTRARASRLEDFMSRVGQKLVSRILQFTSSDRVFSFIGPNEESLAYAIGRQDFLVKEVPDPADPSNVSLHPLNDEERREAFRHLRFSVSPGSSAPGTRARRFQSAMMMNQAGMASRKFALQAADIPDPENMLQDAEADFKRFPPPGWVFKGDSKKGD